MQPEGFIVEKPLGSERRRELHRIHQKLWKELGPEPRPSDFLLFVIFLTQKREVENQVKHKAKKRRAKGNKAFLLKLRERERERERENISGLGLTGK